jgi:hypothetical protein
MKNNMKVNNSSSLSTRSTPIRVSNFDHQSTPNKYSTLTNMYGRQQQQQQTPYNDSLIQLLQTTYKTVNNNPIKSSSLPTTPAMSDYYYNYIKQQSGHETTFSSSNCSSSNIIVKNLRNDLLIAADSVTNAMHCLVKELNSGKLTFFQKTLLKEIYLFKKTRVLDQMMILITKLKKMMKYTKQ